MKENDSTPKRLVSMDAYRGFVMLAMVSAGLGMAGMVNDPTWGWLAYQMRHQDWLGCTFWDLIQPSFMFIVGVAMPFAFAIRQERGQTWTQQFGHVIRRVILLIAIGVFLDWFHKTGPYPIRFIRVLQQIAIGYFLAFFVLGRGLKVQAVTAVALLIVHTLCFMGYGWINDIDPWVKGANFGSWLDFELGLGVNRGGYVTFNAISSTSTILFGVLAGEMLRSDLSLSRKAWMMVGAGVMGLAIGALLAIPIPMVKRIWTASFTVYAAGWTCLMMAFFFVLIEILDIRRWAFPFIVVGMNSIAIYVMAGTLKEPVKKAWRPLGYFFQQYVPYDWALARNRPVYLEDFSVVMSLLLVLSLWLICYWLYRKRIFFKV